MSARNAILGRIRRSLHAGEGDAARAATVAARLSDHPKGLIPQRGQLPRAEKIALFVAMLDKYAASVARLDSHADVPGEVAAYLRGKNLPPSIRRGADPRLAGLDWSSQPNLDVRIGPSDGQDLAGLSHAFAAIAESGTLVLTSGTDNPTTLNFLPEHHLVVVTADEVAGDMETVMDRIRATYGAGTMPRTVNMVTGPSRSGDIEQKILLGAHGPRALHVMIVGS
jgi:L-lactate dehydrogenase complex protein LldG